MRALMFTVVGIAQTQGSARGFIVRRKGDGTPKAVVTNDNPKTKGWRQTIANCAALELNRAEHGRRQFAGPLALEVVFYLPRPKKYLTTRMAGVEVPHTTRPDTDKLVRAVKDALSGVVWHDDAQVTDLIARKRYVAAGQHPRVVIGVKETNVHPRLIDDEWTPGGNQAIGI